MSLPSKVIVITGANRGLGWEFVNQLLFTPTPPHVLLTKEQFCNDDYTVVALARSIDEKQWSGLQDKLTQFNTTNGSKRQLKTAQCDVTNITEIKALTELIKNQFNSRVDIFISNAGIMESSPEKVYVSTILDFDAEIDTLFKVNTLAPVIFTNHLAPFLTNAANSVAKLHGIDLDAAVTEADKKDSDSTEKKNEPSSLQFAQCAYAASFMSSLANTTASYNATYRASKCAMHMYIKTLSFEYPKINFLPIHPGWVATDMGSRAGPPPVLTVDSIRGVLNIMDTHCNQANSGAAMIGYDGKKIPW